MPAPAFSDYLVAVVVLPLVFVLTAVGIGLLLERVLGVRVPNALLIPLGVCGSIVLSMFIYWAGGDDVIAVALTVALTVAGGLLARRGLRSRLNPGWFGLAGLAAYLLFVAPELLSGHWTWSGYNFVNDTATQFLLTAYIKAHGVVNPAGQPPDTTISFVQGYLGTAYPLGAQAHLATLSGLLHSPPPVLYQGYMSALAGTAAISMATLVEGVLARPLAALAGFVAAGAALTYQYALQGNIKELGMVATCAAAVAVGRHVVRRGVDIRGCLLVAVPLAAVLDVYYTAAVPFAGAVAAMLVLAALILRRGWPSARMLAGLGLGLISALVLALPATASTATSFNTLSSNYVGGASPVLGQLARPLPLSEVSGVWLTGDYRFPVPPGAGAELTVLITVVIFVLAGFGVIAALRVGEWGPAAFLVAMGLVVAVLFPSVTPYAGAKVLAIASPAFVLAACVGAEGLRRLVPWRPAGRYSTPEISTGSGPPPGGTRPRSRSIRPVALLAALVAGGLITLGVLGSDVIAYHHDNVAPTRRMLAIQQVGDRFTGRGPMLWNEFEEYAKYFASKAHINVPFETMTPRQAELIYPNSIYAAYYDLDQEQLGYVESFPYIVIRRSPAASRPPADYVLVYRNAYYDVWRRTSGPVVIRHLGLQGTASAAAPAACSAIGQLVSRAPRGSYLVAAVHPSVLVLDTSKARHSSGWGPDPIHPGYLALLSPGTLEAGLRIPAAGTYRVWIQGNFARPVTLQIDGTPAGAAQGINTIDEWYDLGLRTLDPGPHRIRLLRGGGGLGPEDGAPSWLGPIALEADQPEHLEQVPLGRWHSLCGRTLDWIELARGPLRQ